MAERCFGIISDVRFKLIPIALVIAGHYSADFMIACPLDVKEIPCEDSVPILS